MTVETLPYDSPVDALVALVRGLVVYEQRYQMGSAEFFAQYQEGKLGDAMDFVEWAGAYQYYVGLLQELSARVSLWMTPLQSYLLDIRQAIGHWAGIRVEYYREQVLTATRGNLRVRLRVADDFFARNQRGPRRPRNGSPTGATSRKLPRFSVPCCMRCNRTVLSTNIYGGVPSVSVEQQREHRVFH